MRLYCVRHGQSMGNVTSMFHQPEEIPLTETGVTQAHIVAKRLENLSIEAILSSPMTRALQTATYINLQLKLPLETTPLLRECRDNTQLKDKKWDDPEVVAYLAQKKANFDNPNARIGDAETFNEQVERADTFLKMVQKRKEKTILVVSHGEFLNTLAALVVIGKDHLTPHIRGHFFYHTWMNNTGITIFDEWEPFGTTDKKEWHLLTWNDHTHVS